MPRASTLYGYQTEHEEQLRTSCNSCELYRSKEIQLLSKITQEVFLMSEFEYFFFQDQAEFNRLYSDSLIYDFDSMEVDQNEAWKIRN